MAILFVFGTFFQMLMSSPPRLPVASFVFVTHGVKRVCGTTKIRDAVCQGYKMPERDAGSVSCLLIPCHRTHVAARRQASLRATCMSERYTHHAEEEMPAGMIGGAKCWRGPTPIQGGHYLRLGRPEKILPKALVGRIISGFLIKWTYLF